MTKDFFIRATINGNPLSRIMVCWPHNDAVEDASIDELVYKSIDHYLPDYEIDGDDSLETGWDYFLNIEINTLSWKLIWSLAPHSNSKNALSASQVLNCNGREVGYCEGNLYEKE